MSNEYRGINIFNALKDIQVIKDKLRIQYPNFKFVAEKGDIGEVFAIETYKLSQAEYGQSGFDAVSSDGKKVSIKMLWEINQYRSIHLSGGSNRTKDAYREADYLLVLGRDESNHQVSTIYNGPIHYLEKYIKGGAIHPRIEIRNLKKIYAFVPLEERLKAYKQELPDAIPIYYPKDLNQLFDIEKRYWNNFTMLWRNYKCSHIPGLKLNDFLDYDINSQNSGDPLLSFRDIQFLKTSYQYYKNDYDHFTSAFAAFAKINNMFFPPLKKVGKKTLNELNFPDSVLRAYRGDQYIKKYFSYFFNMKHKGPGGRVLTRYLTPHDIKIINRAYEIRGTKKRSRGSISEVNYIKAGRQAAKEIGMAPKFKIPDPRKFKKSTSLI